MYVVKFTNFYKVFLCFVKLTFQQVSTQCSSTYYVISKMTIFTPSPLFVIFRDLLPTPLPLPPKKDQVIFLIPRIPSMTFKWPPMNFLAPEGSIISFFFILSQNWTCSMGFSKESFRCRRRACFIIKISVPAYLSFFKIWRLRNLLLTLHSPPRHLW